MPEQADIVRSIYQWYIDGVGCPSIARRLNDMGVMTRDGRQWERSGVRWVLRNPIYTGKIAYNRNTYKKAENTSKRTYKVNAPDKWIVVDGAHPAIIDTDTYQRADEIMRSRKHAPTRTGEIKSPLVGIVKCGICGRAMVRLPSKKSQPDYLMCSAACCNAMTRLSLVEERLLHVLSQELSTISETITQERQYTQEDYARQLAGINAEMQKNKKQLAKLHDLLEQDVYDTDTFIERSRVLNQRVTELQNAADELQEQIDAAQYRSYDILPRLTELLQYYECATIEEKNTMLRYVVDRAVYVKAKRTPPDDFTLEVFIKEYV